MFLKIHCSSCQLFNYRILPISFLYFYFTSAPWKTEFLGKIWRDPKSLWFWFKKVFSMWEPFSVVLFVCLFAVFCLLYIGALDFELIPTVWHRVYCYIHSNIKGLKVNAPTPLDHRYLIMCHEAWVCYDVICPQLHGVSSFQATLTLASGLSRNYVSL